MTRDPDVQRIADQLVDVADRLTIAKRALLDAMESLVALKNTVAKLEDRMAEKGAE